jgi:hypothetical protein
MNDFEGKEDTHQRVMAMFKGEEAQVVAEITGHWQGVGSVSYEESEMGLGELIEMHAKENTTEEITIIFHRIAEEAAFAADPDSAAENPSRLRALKMLKWRMMERAAMKLIEIYSEPVQPDAAYKLGSIMNMAQEILGQMAKTKKIPDATPKKGRAKKAPQYQLSPSQKRMWMLSLDRITQKAQEAVNRLETPALETPAKPAVAGTAGQSAQKIRTS